MSLTLFMPFDCLECEYKYQVGDSKSDQACHSEYTTPTLTLGEEMTKHSLDHHCGLAEEGFRRL